MADPIDFALVRLQDRQGRGLGLFETAEAHLETVQGDERGRGVRQFWREREG